MKKKFFLILTVIFIGISIFIFLGRKILPREIFLTSIPETYQQAPSSSDWPQLQRDPQKSGYTPETVNYSSFQKVWSWNIDQSNAIRFGRNIQPIVGGGKVFVGAYNGKMYALDENTGSEVWQFQTDGPIFHTAGFDNGRVYFGSDDGYVYCLNADNGNLLWRYKTQAGIWTAPLIVNGNVFTSSRDGFFYALNGQNGSLLWRYDTGSLNNAERALILNSPSYHSSGRIFFGAENMYAYCLSITSGQSCSGWQFPRLYGQSMRNYWPVVSERENKVVFTTMPYQFHRYIHIGASDVLGYHGCGCSKGCDFTRCLDRPTCSIACNDGCEGRPENCYAIGDDQWARKNEAQKVIDYFNQSPQKRTFYVFDINSGNESYIAPVLYTGGGGAPSAMPVIGGDGFAYLIFRSSGGILNHNGFGCVTGGLGVDIGRMNLASGSISSVGVNGPALTSFNSHFRATTDEMSVLSMGGNNLYVTMSQSVGGIDVANEAPFFVIRERQGGGDGRSYPGDLALFGAEDLVYSTDNPGGHVAPSWGPASIAGGKIFWKSDGSGFVAVRGN